MRVIRDCLDNYPYISMDTEFPGVIARPIGSFSTSSDYHYQTMRCNVDLLKVIQVGITLFDEHGNFPEETTTWQFNFKFNLQEEMYSPDQIERLQKAGMDFQRHEEYGIMPNDFAELMITSGMVLSKDVKYISFHSGYDFGYFLRLLSNTSLPTTEDAFSDLLSIWFPTVYDIKFMMRSHFPAKGGLPEVAEDLGVPRLAIAHQAGSDSLLIALTFRKLMELYFNDSIDDTVYNHKIYGLGQTFSPLSGNSDPRNGITAAEREDRSIPRENGQTSQLAAAQAAAQNSGVTMSMPPMQGMPNPLSTNPYAMGANGPYNMRPLVSGR